MVRPAGRCDRLQGSLLEITVGLGRAIRVRSTRATAQGRIGVLRVRCCDGFHCAIVDGSGVIRFFLFVCRMVVFFPDYGRVDVMGRDVMAQRRAAAIRAIGIRLRST